MTEYNFQADINKFDPGTIRYNGENALFSTGIRIRKNHQTGNADAIEFRKFPFL